MPGFKKYKNLKRYLVFIFLLLTGLKVFAHGVYTHEPSSGTSDLANYRVDSLKTLLAPSLANKDTPIDTLTINRINNLASEFIDVNPDSALYYGKLAIDKS